MNKMAVFTPITLPSILKRWPAGVALIDRGIDLNIVVIRPRTDITSARRDDAGGDGATETKRIADRDDPIADAWVILGELHIWKAFVGIDLDQGKVGLRIGADDLGLVDCTIISSDLHGLGMVDHVIVGHRITVC